MKVILFGGSGMVGQGVLRECLAADDVHEVVSLVRAATGTSHPKLSEIVHADLTDLASLERSLANADACFFCLGTSAAGMSEDDYRRITYDLTLSVARFLVGVAPAITFIYVSGAGTDSSEKGRSMWARVKGRTENDLLAMPFHRAYMFRPGMIRPLHGVVSKTRLYRVFYTILAPVLPALEAVFPAQVINTELVGRAMLNVVRENGPSRVLESRELSALGRVTP